MTDKETITVPRGWEHKKGYRLESDGASIEYLADGRYHAIIESEVEGITGSLEYLVIVLKRHADNPVKGPMWYPEKEEAIEAFEDAMQDLQTEITAPVEYHDDAYRIGGGRGGEVSGIDHEGGRYCIECARDHMEIDLEKYITDPKSVPSGGPVFIDTEAEFKYYCDSCDRQIEMVIIGGGIR